MFVVNPFVYLQSASLSFVCMQEYACATTLQKKCTTLVQRIVMCLVCKCTEMPPDVLPES